ncbi:MAG: ribosome maturation factor RimP [Bacilli bacterium]|nr:ribosome maturation factor RimP [Bacilli bacterium]
MNKEEVITIVSNLIKDVLEEEKVFIYDLDFVKEGKDYILRILIDNEAQNVDLDICISVSEKISKLLDKADPIKEEYMLEVASPGVERPLKTFEQYQKAIGSYIILQVKERVLDYDELVGDLKGVDNTGIDLEIRIKTRVKTVHINFENITNCMTTVKF